MLFKPSWERFAWQRSFTYLCSNGYSSSVRVNSLDSNAQRPPQVRPLLLPFLLSEGPLDGFGFILLAIHSGRSTEPEVSSCLSLGGLPIGMPMPAMPVAEEGENSPF